MAKAEFEVPNELLKVFEDLDKGSEKMLGEMVDEGAKVVYSLVKSNMQSAFKSTGALNKGLKVTKVYKTPSDDGINVHIGFYGYDRSKTSARYPNGTPIPLIAMAREYGTSSGEAKKPFLRKSFNKAQIEQAMLKVQDKYIKGD